MLKIDFSIQCQWSWLDEYIGNEKIAKYCVYNCTVERDCMNLDWFKVLNIYLFYEKSFQNSFVDYAF